ncbi:helicase-like protein [Trifolium pratense]|uniref:Helicase-like protein n=1 Tax=Trifolium pratense TaxID=57577 RepID=A0A2K3NMI7_TRIPR|nr:helicase-like protein [Trifolium pratense]
MLHNQVWLKTFNISSLGGNLETRFANATSHLPTMSTSKPSTPLDSTSRNPKCAKQKRKVPDLNLDFDANSDNSTSSQSESEDNYMDYSTASSSDEEDQHPTNNDNNVQDEGYSDIGDPNWDCNACGAAMWYQERKGRGPPTIWIQGQTCHRMGSLLPLPGQSPKFAQLYIYDTDNEINNRMQGFSTTNDISTNCAKIEGNSKGFRMARDRLEENHSNDLRLKLLFERTTDGRIYNQPTFSEVSAPIVGDVDYASCRDIILERQSVDLKELMSFIRLI